MKIRFLPNNSPKVIEFNSEVERNYLRVEGAETISRANQLDSTRNYDGAIKTIEEFEKDFKNYEARNGVVSEGVFGHMKKI